MSLAFSALLAAVLLLPGIIFRYLYIRSDSLRKSIDLSLLSESVFILLSSMLLHWLGRGIYKTLYGAEASLRPLYNLLTGKEAPDFAVVDAGFSPFVIYISALCVIGGLAALALQRFVIYFRLDERYKLLRIHNDWDKYLSGDVLRRETGQDFDYVQVDVLVDTSAGDVLYSGILDNYTLNKDQMIDRLFLSDVYRRDFSADVAPTAYGAPGNPAASVHQVSEQRDFSDARYYRLPGNYLVIPFGQIRNLNIIYTRLREMEEKK